jgi:ABC-type bacteriocin/lantibiotic exporter with double-glycine peptidase domain
MDFDFKRIIWDFLKGHKFLSIGTFLIALVIAPLHNILLPHLYGQFVNRLDGPTYKSTLIYIVIVLVILQVSDFIKELFDMHFNPRLFDYVKTQMIDAFMKKHDGDLLEPRSGQLISKIVRAPDLIAWWTAAVVEYFIPQIIAFVIAFFYFLKFDVVLAGSLTLMFAVLGLLLFFAPCRCSNVSIHRERALDDVHEDIEDLLRNLSSIYSHNKEEVEIAKLHLVGESFVKANIKAVGCILKYKAIGMPVVIAFIVSVVVRCVYLFQAKRIDKGDFVAIFTMTTSLIGTLTWLIWMIKDTTFDMGTILDATHTFSIAPPQTPKPSTFDNTSPPFANGIGFKNVTLCRSRNCVIRDLTLHFEAHQWTSVSGDIGTGKSTLFKLMMGFATPQVGSLYIDNHWYADLTMKDVRKKIAYMPQDSILFDRSIYENIVYGNIKKSRSDVTNIMKDLGIWHEFSGKEMGLDSKVGKNGSKLSGGQRQLVMFMRLVLIDPQFILLDEPTSFMDDGTKKLLVHALQKFAKGKTIIMITHDADLLQYATRNLSWYGNPKSISINNQ